MLCRSLFLAFGDLIRGGRDIALFVIFQRTDPAIQLGDALGDDVRQILLVEVVGGVDRLVVDPHHFGRHADGTANADYCIYCCPDGEEAMTGTLEEMIDFCVPIEVRLGLFPDEPAARKALSEYLPTLKRWKK